MGSLKGTLPSKQRFQFPRFETSFVASNITSRPAVLYKAVKFPTVRGFSNISNCSTDSSRMETENTTPREKMVEQLGFRGISIISYINVLASNITNKIESIQDCQNSDTTRLPPIDFQQCCAIVHRTCSAIIAAYQAFTAAADRLALTLHLTEMVLLLP